MSGIGWREWKVYDEFEILFMMTWVYMDVPCYYQW
jgi:hypothetical protein